MKVLVTGDRGYIGTVLVPMLRHHGHDVIGLDAGWYDGCDFGPAQISSSRSQDVREVGVWELEGFDALIHLAAVSNDPVGNLDPNATYSINHRASVRLAKAARAAGVPRFLFASSCSLYGAAGSVRVDERASFNPLTPYGRSKVLAEHDISQLADDDFSPTFLRNATAYGSSPRLRADIVVNNLAGLAYTTGQVLLQSDGSPWRPLVHVDDISRAFLTVLESPRHIVHNQAFNVGRDEDNLRIRDVAEIVQSAFPGSQVVFGEKAGPDARDYRVNFGKISTLLSAFQPRWTVPAGVDQLLGDFAKYGLELEDFLGPRYTRLARIRQLIEARVLNDHLYRSTSANEPRSSTKPEEVGTS